MFSILDIQYTDYLDFLQSYTTSDQTTKALILIGYVERDFIRFYRAGRIEEGLKFARDNLQRSRTLLNQLSPTEKVVQLNAFVDILSFEGIQNHVNIYQFIELQLAYHQRLKTLPVTTKKYMPLVYEIVRDFGHLAQKDGLSYTSHLEATLDVIYYIHAHLHRKVTVKKVLEHVNKRYNPLTIQRVFTKEMNMSIRDYINMEKIREAERLLLASKTPIQKIAHELNFYDAADFSKRFKREIGMTPLEYRQQNSQID
ncbi:helix-turn-helix transcriptional regulator [Lactiplantibacillus mudanjiangensis]|uniref:Transcription regulator [Lactobacillus brevis KB290] n=1 Tax=Lactiplantibacillus mudanjiangensis TaxID=1296538 RepID=A0A660DXG8_9LACO|nr:AraC family transcriptional regulator [Lactiplantibacillus mudanjiangensis]VDG21193.1 Transcription regulator [Lactobacillus brevis KB290] [Lactiplantibacillus mudanjiangensis]VDG22869.1 Transcription regulator [Lactobacillus brevis KB290] [Lactiplantibacillus mudanjiangensis]VDG26556.1 Transcription regulator [Lactobacillus brevis KB290] [Lactiplantibacillus mudanjiangensis]VDG31796.1 Transcription regulator [Lactobacillus brevis KB290] [Lactiplantibacillus mudanjiangensis]